MGEAFGAAASAGSGLAAFGKSAFRAAVGGGAGGFVGSLFTQVIDKGKADFKAAAKDSLTSAFAATLASPFGIVPWALEEVSIAKNAASTAYEVVFDTFTSALTGSN